MATVAIELPDEAFSAMIVGLDRTDFLDALTAEKIDVFEVDIESLQRELARG